MAIPTPKNPSIDALLTSITGMDRKEQIVADRCVFCKGEAVAFDDETSKREFSISGICQTCQNEVFDA